MKSLVFTLAAIASVTVTAKPTAAPCALARDAWRTAPAPTGDDGRKGIPALLAYNCLKSVPLHTHRALEMVDSIAPYLEWQTTQPYLANPPKDYHYPPVDISQRLKEVRDKVSNSKYDSEYEFQVDLVKSVFGAAHDGHYRFDPDVLGTFSFARKTPLVSVSEDGSSLPVIKLASDVLANATAASVITHINGVPAAEFIQAEADEVNPFQDPDASYNAMFYTPALGSSPGFFAQSNIRGSYYRGATTEFKFANGTIATFENMATVLQGLDGVRDGKSFYEEFCSDQTEESAATLASAALPPLPTDRGDYAFLKGYPTPEVVTITDNTISSFYLDEPGLEDVVVVVLTQFDSVPNEFADTLQKIFSAAKTAGKTKLAIDLQSNGGGVVLLGYDFFREFFPQTVPDGFSRFRDNNAFRAIGEIYSSESARLDVATSGSIAAIADSSLWFNYRRDLNLTNQPFLSYKDKFNPQEFAHTNYTPIYRWNLTDPLQTTNTTFGIGIEIAGYGSRKNLTQPFLPENIALLYNGECSSTCTTVSAMFRAQGAKTVVFGGRPKTGPMQAVGGTKGTQVLPFDSIYQFTQRAASLTKNPAYLAEFARYNAVAPSRGGGSVNVRDNILPSHLKDGLPAQFLVESADCRLPWTAGSIGNVTEIWKAAARAVFNGAKCLDGGIAKAAAVSGANAAETAWTKPAPLAPVAEAAIRDWKWRARHWAGVKQ